MSDKCVVCEENPRVGDCALCAECDKSHEETKFGDIEWAAKRAREKLLESFQIEPAATCGECMGYEWGDSKNNMTDWYPGSCGIEDVSDELPHDAPPPDWCPLRKNPVLIVLKENNK